MNRQSEIRLVEFFRQHPSLWDPDHEDFKNRSLRDFLCSELAAELKVNPRRVLDKWRNMRTQYGRELKKEKRRPGSSKWFHYPAMHRFLGPVMLSGQRKPVAVHVEPDASLDYKFCDPLVVTEIEHHDENDQTNDAGGDQPVQSITKLVFAAPESIGSRVSSYNNRDSLSVCQKRKLPETPTAVTDNGESQTDQRELPSSLKSFFGKRFQKEKEPDIIGSFMQHATLMMRTKNWTIDEFSKVQMEILDVISRH